MDRRHFLSLIAVSLLSLRGAETTKLDALKLELRDRYGEDTDQILSAASECIRDVVAAHPDRASSPTEDDLDFLVDVVMDELVPQLERKGITLR